MPASSLRGKCLSAAVFAAGLCARCGSAFAQGVPDYGFHFVTIGSPGNAAYDGPDPFNELGPGRGSVAYEYRIARTEVTTGQWMEFFNTFATDPSWLAVDPNQWGAWQDLDAPGNAPRWELKPIPNAAMLPASGINWRICAMYCNWLHNDKTTDPSAILSGAYDVSTFGQNPDGSFTDQFTRSPGARFWIPSLDEWIKAAHFDPDRHGEDQPGWWVQTNGSDVHPVPGLPGVGETNAWMDAQIGDAAWNIPLEAYPQTQSPWGLLDLTGGGAEWVEEVAFGLPFGRLPRQRYAKGAAVDYALPPDERGDPVFAWNSSFPESGSFSLRIASTIPTVSTCSVLVSILICIGPATRRWR